MNNTEAEEKELLIKQFKIYQAPLMSVGKELEFLFYIKGENYH